MKLSEEDIKKMGDAFELLPINEQANMLEDLLKEKLANEPEMLEVFLGITEQMRRMR